MRSSALGRDSELNRTTDRTQGVESNWARQQMSNADFVGVAPDASGKLRRVYANSTVILFAAVGENVIVTVMQPNKHVEWRTALRKIAERELRKYQAASLKEEQTLISRKASLDSEIIGVRLSLLTARSERKKADLQSKLSELIVESAVSERNLNENRRKFSNMTQSFYATLC